MDKRKPEESWNYLLNYLGTEGKDIKGFGIQKKKYSYFNAKSEGGKVIVDNAKNNNPSYKIAASRVISYKEFESIHDMYPRYIAKEPGVRQDMRAESRNSSYILALIHEIFD